MGFFKFSRYFKLIMLFSISIIIGCDFIDLRVDKIILSHDYGNLQSRVPKHCRYYKKGEKIPNAKDYNVLAMYVVQERSIAISSHSAKQMICYIYKKATDNGADAIIIDEISNQKVAVDNNSTSPVVQAIAIRFKGEPPKQ